MGGEKRGEGKQSPAGCASDPLHSIKTAAAFFAAAAVGRGVVCYTWAPLKRRGLLLRAHRLPLRPSCALLLILQIGAHLVDLFRKASAELILKKRSADGKRSQHGKGF